MVLDQGSSQDFGADDIMMEGSSDEKISLNEPRRCAVGGNSREGPAVSSPTELILFSQYPRKLAAENAREA